MSGPGIPSSPASLSGLRLGSCFLEEPLGVGGMGTVYLARQERPHRSVAVKVLHPHLASDPDAWAIFLERFRREADAAAGLDHANIVPIFEFGEDGGMVYLVMPYLADGSLSGLLDREGVLPAARAAHYVEQAAAALDYAHEHGIVHRDVKPSNLLLHPDGRLMLADFGIARPILPAEPIPADPAVVLTPAIATADPALTLMGTAMGTPEYMAPEQVRGEAITAATDIYALGIVAYVMLAGHTPFGGEDLTTVLTSQLFSPPRPLRPARPEIPARVEEALFWAMAKDPAERPSSATEFARALRDAARTRTLGAVLARSQPAVAAGWGLARGIAPSGRPSLSARPSSFARSFSSAHPTPSGRLAPSGTRPLTRPHTALTAPPPAASSTLEATRLNTRPDEPTLLDAGMRPYDGAPQWPLPSRGGGDGGRGPRKRLGVVPVGMGLLALVLTILLAMTAYNVAASFATRADGSGPGVGRTATTTLPTATPEPTATPFPTDWLSLSPNSISLDCHGDGRSTTVVLTNNGPHSVEWRSTVTKSFGSAEVSLSPNNGKLNSGRSVTVAVTNNSRLLEHSGQVQFSAQNGDAGQPATLTFTTGSCLP